MISYAHWVAARDLIKKSSGYSIFKGNRLKPIDTAIRLGNRDQAVLAINNFKTGQSEAAVAKYGDLIEWLEAHLDDLEDEDPDEDELRGDGYRLHPFIVPSAWDLKLSEASKAAWRSSAVEEAKWHTFIGVTHMHTGDSAIFPCFMEDSSGDRVFNPAMGRSARAVDVEVKPVNVGGTIFAPIIEEKRVPTTVRADGPNTATKASIIALYGENDKGHSNAIIEAYQQSNFGIKDGPVGAIELTWSIDGMFHKAACNKIPQAETDSIGWSIKGSKARGTGSIRFVSGRNLGKFRSEFRRPGHEGRDMPAPYASAIAQMLKRDLGIFLKKKVTLEVSGRGHDARHWQYRV